MKLMLKITTGAAIGAFVALSAMTASAASAFPTTLLENTTGF